MSEKISYARLTIPNAGLTPVEVYGRLNPAGGGVVHNSDPMAEYFESIHKMAAPLEALSRAEEFRWRNRQNIATGSANSKPARTIIREQKCYSS